MSKEGKKALKENKSFSYISKKSSNLEDLKNQEEINSLIEITSQRVTNLHNYYPQDNVDIDKMYLNNIRALSLLYKIKKDFNSFDAKKVKIEIDYDSILKNIINNKNNQ